MHDPPSRFDMRVLDSRVLVWSISSRSRQLATLAIIGLGCSALAFLTLRIAIATTLGESDRPATIETALSLDPSNAALHHRLGMLRYDAPAPGAESAGLADLQRATELNPNEALYWSDLASACESSGDTGCADDATGRALSLSPSTPRVYWRAANYYLRSIRQQKALALFRRLLDLDPSYAEPVFQVCSQALGSAGLVAKELLAHPQNPEVELAFVGFVSGRGDDDSAFAAWRQFASERKESAGTALPASEMTLVASYLDRLIFDRRDAEAESVWADANNLHLVTTPAEDIRQASAADPSNLLFNGGFETVPLNWGFDWRYRSTPFVESGPSATTFHTGARCWRLAFTAPVNGDYESVWQMVPVRPNQGYVLSAFVRSESITSDSGPRLRVVDPFCEACTNLTTEGTVGTTPWHLIQARFATTSPTRFVKVSLWRPRSRSFPSEIQGQFWLDDVSLKDAGTAQDSAAVRSDLQPQAGIGSLH